MIIPIKDANRVFFTYNGTPMPVKQIYYNDSSVTYIKIFEDFYSQYLTFENIGETTEWIKFNKTLGVGLSSISYSTDNGVTWTTTSFGTDYTPQTITVDNIAPGSKVLWKGVINDGYTNLYGYFSTQGYNILYGNINSLVLGDLFIGNDTCFRFDSAFSGDNGNTIKITDASNLILPAKHLIPSCYFNLFSNCTDLVGCPKLPATVLANNCYSQMFFNCIRITDMPELPVTDLASKCYYAMFMYCSHLAVSKDLPATTLANNCYEMMFQNCIRLHTAPKLYASVLTQGCYKNMFYGCTSLNDVTCLAEDISATDCTTDWLLNASATGTFYKSPVMTSWNTGTSGIPGGWTVQDA